MAQTLSTDMAVLVAVQLLAQTAATVATAQAHPAIMALAVPAVLAVVLSAVLQKQHTALAVTAVTAAEAAVAAVPLKTGLEVVDQAVVAATAAMPQMAVS